MLDIYFGKVFVDFMKMMSRPRHATDFAHIAAKILPGKVV